MKAFRCIPMIVVMGIIFFLSHQPDESLSIPSFFASDKLCHIVAYATLAAATLFAVSSSNFFHDHKHKTSLLIVLFCALYGVSDEFHQSFIPGRMVSALDLIADITGAGLVLGGVSWLRKLQKDKKRAKSTS
jgi:VanZ family protein